MIDFGGPLEGLRRAAGRLEPAAARLARVAAPAGRQEDAVALSAEAAALPAARHRAAASVRAAQTVAENARAVADLRKQQPREDYFRAVLTTAADSPAKRRISDGKTPSTRVAMADTASATRMPGDGSAAAGAFSAGSFMYITTRIRR